MKKYIIYGVISLIIGSILIGIILDNLIIIENKDIRGVIALFTGWIYGVIVTLICYCRYNKSLCKNSFWSRY